MLEIMNTCKYNGEPEDIYFSIKCNKVKLNKPTFDKAKKFSIEQILNDNTFGVHKPWINQIDFNKLINMCPQVVELKKLND
jgi:hypothetical protein